MVFSDPIFLFAFLPVALALILLSAPRGHNLFILLLSLTFYYWTSGWLVMLLAGSILGNWAIGRGIGAASDEASRRRLLTTGVALNLGVLAYFKYAYFIAQNIDFVLPLETAPLVEAIILPIGISFFTFQAISYLVDLFRREIEAEPNPIRFGAYLSFFPQLIAGPIVRYADVAADFRAPKISTDNLAAGATRFLHGLAKKVLIADTAGVIADACFGLDASQTTLASAWLGAFAFTVQIYFDFSGYSDMAIGVGRMCGVRFQENFLRPYSSSTITEYWRRWHVSLSSWFRDYLFIPLGGSRQGVRATYRNLLIVFLLTGLWHGAAWTFVIWGLYNGAFLVAERLIFKGRAAEVQATWMRFVYAAPVWAIGLLIFRSDDLGHAGVMLAALVDVTDPQAFQVDLLVRQALDPFAVWLLVLGGSVFFFARSPSTGVWLERTGGVGAEAVRLSYAIVAGLSAVTISLSRDFSPFIYFQF